MTKSKKIKKLLTYSKYALIVAESYYKNFPGYNYLCMHKTKLTFLYKSQYNAGITCCIDFRVA